MGLFSFIKKQKVHKFYISNHDLTNTKKLYIHLMNSKGIDKLNISKEIHNQLNDINPIKLLKVDKSFRESFKQDWMYDWKK